MTFSEFKMKVHVLLWDKYKIDMDKIDSTPLLHWFTQQQMSVKDAAHQLAVKDGFPDEY